MLRKICLAILGWMLVAGCGMAAPENARPLALEDYYRLVAFQSPAMSPDGRWVAFIKSTIVEAENRRQNELWLVATDGRTPPRRLSDPSLDAASPRWSPSGRLLAFSGRSLAAPASADEGAAIWFLPMDQPHAAPFHVRGVSGLPIFSPDNRWIAFTRRAAQPKAPQYVDDQDRLIHERFKGHAYDWMNFRADQIGYLPDPRDPEASPAEELFIVASIGGEPRQLTHLNVNVRGVQWRPDSGALVFSADTHQRDEYSYERADLFVVALDGKVERLTDDGYNNNAPTWSPNGQTICFRRQLGLSAVIAAKQDHGAPVDIYTIPANGGTMKNLTADWDFLPGSPGWGFDSRFIYFGGGMKGISALLRVPSEGGAIEQVTHGDRILTGFSPSGHYETMAYVGTDSSHPEELFVSAMDGGHEKQVTTFNRALVEAVRPVPAERILFPSRDGTMIEGWVLKPRGYDPSRSWPLILTIHGGPHGAFGNDFSFEHQLLAAQGYLVVYTNPRGSATYGEKFLWATWGDWGNLDFEDVMSGVDYAESHYNVDPQRLGVTGYSYGGFLSNWIIGHTTRFAAAVVGAGISNWISDYGTSTMARTKESEFYGPPWDLRAHTLLVSRSPIEYVANVTTPALYLHGESDMMNPIEQSEQMYTALKKRGVPARFVRYADTYHGGWTPWNMVNRYYEELRWFRHYLNGAESGAGK
jgi:dipeptidyl aminopeptidase/acylaminoacyl peptidase